jgi:hypothetical protein
MNASEILNSKTLASDIADVLDGAIIDGSESILVHKNSGDFKLVTTDRVGYMVSNQGWTECVANDTLVQILGNQHEVSDGGMEEGDKVAEWMRAQS